jgi:hypothetical protein
LIHRISEQFYLKDLYKKGLSGLVRKHLDIRYEKGDYTVVCTKIQVEEQDLYIYFSVNNTFSAKAVTVFTGGGQQKPSNNYTVIFEFENFFSTIDGTFLDENVRSQESIVEDLMSKLPARVWANDPSWYFQGHWETMDKKDNSVFPFPGPKGKDIWQAKHQASGGLQGKWRMTKHIAQILEELRDHLSVITQHIVNYANKEFGNSKSKNKDKGDAILELWKRL